MLFKVGYANELGDAKTLFLEAENEESVYQAPAFSANLLSVTALPDALSGLLLKKLTLESQLLLVSQVSTLVLSGGDIGGIREIVTAMPELGGIENDPRFRHASTITDFLTLSGVDSVTLMLVKAGEEAGTLAESLEDAVVDIEKRMELKAATKGDVSKGLFYVFAGFAMVVGMSMILNQIIMQLMESDRIDVNSGTHMLIFINNAFTSYLPVTAGLVAGTVFVLVQSWSRSTFFRDIPIVKTYNNYRKVSRSLTFVSTFRPLYLSGVPMMDALAQIRGGMRGLDREALDKMTEEVRNGKSVAGSLSKDYWSVAFRIGMKPFDEANVESRKRLLFRIQGLLQTELQTLGKRLGAMMLTVGMLAAITGILLMAFGFYMPMIGGMKMY